MLGYKKHSRASKLWHINAKTVEKIPLQKVRIFKVRIKIFVGMQSRIYTEVKKKTVNKSRKFLYVFVAFSTKSQQEVYKETAFHMNKRWIYRNRLLQISTSILYIRTRVRVYIDKK